jgi:hypothetical protein
MQVEPNGRGERRAGWVDLEPIAIGAPGGAPEYPLVVVDWHDAWFDLDQAAADDCRSGYPVRTAGFLVGNGPEFVSIAQEVLPDGEGFRAVTHIPRAMVDRTTHLSPDDS